MKSISLLNSNLIMLQIFSDEYFMNKALEEAKKAFDSGEIPVGCIIVCKKQIIARSHNLTERLNDVTAHAEMQAITAASNQLGGKYLNECDIFVTVEPCAMCAGALNWSQMGRLVYGIGDNKKGYSLHSPNLLHPKTIVKKGVLESESADLMKLFFSDKR
jgi:tRNA(adenine34) deaminase